MDSNTNMTYEELKPILLVFKENAAAIQIIKNELNPGEDIKYTAIQNVKKENFVWVIDQVIQALEQQPCKDAISRDEAIRISEQGQIQGYEWQFKKLCNLPPVTQQRPKGNWLKCKSRFGVEYFKCSECGRKLDWIDKYDNYCNNCGSDNSESTKELVKMVEYHTEFHTCGRCKWEDLPDGVYPCNQCRWGEDKRKDLWKPKEDTDGGIKDEKTESE